MQTKKKNYTIAIAGPRPQDLPCGYHWMKSEWTEKFITRIKNFITEKITEYPDYNIVCISTMELGTGLLFSKAVTELKEKNSLIQLIAMIPCSDQTARWHGRFKEFWSEMALKSDKIVYTSQQKYEEIGPHCIKIRNEKMIDMIEDGVLLAVSNGEEMQAPYFQIQYAKENNKQVEIILPEAI